MIKDVEKTIEFKKVYSRWIDREFNAILFKDVDTKANSKWEMDFKINPLNMQLANDYLVKAMTQLTDEQIDELAIADYNAILEKVQELKTPSSK